MNSIKTLLNYISEKDEFVIALKDLSTAALIVGNVCEMISAQMNKCNKCNDDFICDTCNGLIKLHTDTIMNLHDAAYTFHTVVKDMK